MCRNCANCSTSINNWRCLSNFMLLKRRIMFEWILLKKWPRTSSEQITGWRKIHFMLFIRCLRAKCSMLIKKKGGDHTGLPFSTELQLHAVLRYYATGCIQVVAGDLHGLSQSYISILVRHVSKLLADKGKDTIMFPTSQQRLNEIRF